MGRSGGGGHLLVWQNVKKILKFIQVSSRKGKGLQGYADRVGKDRAGTRMQRMHVLKYVELSEGGRGKKGGLSEYARMIGKSQDAMSLVKKAAIVFGKLPSQLGCLLDKATHLAAIHKAPEQYWQQLTELLIEKEWSVKETEATNF